MINNAIIALVQGIMVADACKQQACNSVLTQTAQDTMLSCRKPQPRTLYLIADDINQ